MVVKMVHLSGLRLVLNSGYRHSSLEYDELMMDDKEYHLPCAIVLPPLRELIITNAAADRADIVKMNLSISSISSICFSANSIGAN